MRSDLYAFAGLVYEALLGKRAIEGDTIPEMIQGTLYDRPLPASLVASWLPEEADALFAAAMAKDPEDRPGELLAWALRLADLLDGCTGPATGWPDPLPLQDSGPPCDPDAATLAGETLMPPEPAPPAPPCESSGA